MLHRFFVHFSLVVLFAFTQMGVATHEISHFSDLIQHTQQDSKSKQDQQAPNHKCEQCLGHANAASGLAASNFVFAAHQSVSLPVTDCYFSYLHLPYRAYSARAPPQTA
ncbi:MAG: hypothetical protein V4575_05235 [Pseudomonadota bacterium]